MALVHHVSDIRSLPCLPFVEQYLVEYAEDLVGVNRSQSKVIVSIAAVIEVKTAEHCFCQQPCHNLLDILALIMVACINQHSRLFSCMARQRHGHSPISNVG